MDNVGSGTGLAYSNVPCLIAEDNRVVDLNQSFICFTGYSKQEIIENDLSKLFDILRIYPKVDYLNIDTEIDYFLFAKNLDYRNVRIVAEKLDFGYIKYQFYERKNSRFEDKFAAVQKLLLDERFGVGIYTSPDLTLIKANQVYLNELNEPFNKKENALSKRLDEILNLKNFEKGQEAFYDVVRTGNTFYGKEIVRITDSLENSYCDNTIIPVYEKGSIKFVISIIEDVTEKVLARIKNEEQKRIIEEQKRQLEAIIDNVSDELYIVDKHRNYIKINKAAKQWYKPLNVKKLSDFYDMFKYFDLSGNIIDMDNSIEARVIRGEELKDYPIIEQGTSIRHLCCNGKPIFDEGGNFTMGVLNIRDTTNEVLYKSAIERQAEMLYQIIYNLDLPLLRLSCPDLNILDINQKSFKIMRAFRPDIANINEIIGCSIKNISEGFTRNNLEHIKNAMKSKKTQYIKNRRYMIDGSEIYANIIFEPILGLSGEVKEIVMAMIDVTSEVEDNKNMQKIMKQQEEFLANISHELKTPLNVIYAAAQLFNMYCRKGSLDENKTSIMKYLDTITKNCYRLSKLVNNIVDLSKIEAGFYEITKSNNDIVSLIEEIVGTVIEYAQSKGISIIFDTDIEEKVIACDPEKIERVVLNLISNAIKFSSEGDKIYVVVSDKGESIEFSVTDSGTGIDKNQVDKIFERFKQADKSFSRNAEGTGIGLSLVKAIVELHGGRVLAESELGKGSKFKVFLPTQKIDNDDFASESSMRLSSKQRVNVELSDIW